MVQEKHIRGTQIHNKEAIVDRYNEVNEQIQHQMLLDSSFNGDDYLSQMLRESQYAAEGYQSAFNKNDSNNTNSEVMGGLKNENDTIQNNNITSANRYVQGNSNYSTIQPDSNLLRKHK